MRNKIFIAVVLVLSSCKEMKKRLSFYNPPDFTPSRISPTDKEHSSVHIIAHFSFINQRRETVTNKNVEKRFM